MSEEKIELVPFSDPGFDRLIELSLTTYAGREISDQSYLGWEYIKNPDGPALIGIAESGDKIVSQYLVLPRLFSINNILVPGSLSVNTLTHPDYRGKNLFASLTEETFRQCRESKILFTIGFPNPLSLPVIKKKRIFEIAGYLPLLIKPLSPVKLLISYISDKKNKTGNEIELIIPEMGKNPDADVSIFDISEDAKPYEIFLDEFNRENQNVTFRSLAYLRWRYIDIPLRKYYLIKYRKGDRITALAVCRSRFMYGVRSLILIDIISIDPTATVSLLKAVDAIAKINNIDLIITSVPKHSSTYRTIIKSKYYSMPRFLLPQKLALIVKRHHASCPEQVSDFTKWFLTFGDYDIF